MAKKSVLERNDKRQKMIKASKEKRAALKKQIKDPNLTLQERFSLAQKLDALPVDGSSIRYRNRCFMTGRGRGMVHKSLGISRIMLRELVAKGQVSGIKKASW